MTLPASAAEFHRITLTRQRYVWQPRYVRDPWPLPTTATGVEQIKREMRRELLYGHLPRMAHDRVGIAERWLTRQLRKKGWVVIQGTGRELWGEAAPAFVLENERYVKERWPHMLADAKERWAASHPAYCVHAFKKPADVTWDDAQGIGRWPLWRKRSVVELVLPEGAPA